MGSADNGQAKRQLDPDLAASVGCASGSNQEQHKSEGRSDAPQGCPLPEARKSALESDYAALYAVAGLTDALAEALKAALADTQQKASKRLTELADQASRTE